MGDFSDDVGFEDPTMTVKRGTTKVMPQKQQDENLEDEEQEMSPEEKEELAHLPKGYIYNNCDSFQLAGRISSENIFLSIVSSSNGCAYRIQILPERGTKLIQSVHLRSIVFVTSDTPREVSFCKILYLF